MPPNLCFKKKRLTHGFGLFSNGYLHMLKGNITMLKNVEVL